MKEIACFKCDHKGHKKFNCRFYENELERPKKNQKDTTEKKYDVDNKGKEKGKANIASGVIIEEILDTKDSVCTADIRITDTALVNAFLAVKNFVIQTWIIALLGSAFFHFFK